MAFAPFWPAEQRITEARLSSVNHESSRSLRRALDDRRTGDRVMAIAAASAANFQAASQQGLQSLAPHKHGGHHFQSIVDVDAAGSSLSSAPSATGKTGSKVNMTV
jgi:hypothetical protein